MVSFPILMGRPPPSGITSARNRWPDRSVGPLVRLATSIDGTLKVRDVYAFRRARSALWGLAVSARSSTLRSPARSTTATETSYPSALHAAIAACATLSASCSEMFRSVRICALTPSGASARIAATANVDLSCTKVSLSEIVGADFKVGPYLKVGPYFSASAKGLRRTLRSAKREGG